MDDLRKQLVERLKKANNILVTVRNNPSVDLLSACIGLALVLDKMEKHAAAVFSGEVPSAMEFLKPEDTIERTPDSLRDFIIALDKSKADKLRYKVEDKVVRIFITPYKTSLSQDDLEFSQGDFNVDAVVALGAHEQQELDEAITAHGRILHDATVISINNTANGNLGSMNWQNLAASSISEMVTQLVQDLSKGVLDEQIATALLTGIVAETARFSNDKTTPQTMVLAGDLMAAGANQQLVASSLQAAAQAAEHEPLPIPAHQEGVSSVPSPANEDGTLEIDHDTQDEAEGEAGEKQSEKSIPESEPAMEPEHMPEPSVGEPEIAPEEPTLPKIIAPTRELLPERDSPHISSVHGSSLQETPFTAEGYSEENPLASRSYLVDAPVIPNTATMPAEPDVPADPRRINPLDIPPAVPPSPLVMRGAPPVESAEALLPSFPASSDSPSANPFAPPVAPLPPLPQAAPAPGFSPPGLSDLELPPPIMPASGPAAAMPSAPPADDAGQTLEEIEESVHSPHVADEPADTQGHDVDAARDRVLDALNTSANAHLEPLQSVGAGFLSAQLHPPDGGADGVPPPAPPAEVHTGIEVDADGTLRQTGPAAPAPLVSPAAQPPVSVPPGMAPPAAPPPGPPPVMPMHF